jgi:hypothetical protein
MPTNAWTLLGQVLLLIGAVLGAGGGLRYLVEPILQRRRLRKVMATGLWLACYELRTHIESIRETLGGGGDDAHKTRDALLKIPKNDFGGRADWFVKVGYYTMITAYKIAVFSSWMRIYQITVLKALLATRSNRYTSELFQKFDAYKVAASTNTILWYSYIDAIGEKLILADGDASRPIGFSDFCKRYAEDKQFLFFFDQLHMFIHFLGRTDDPWRTEYETALIEMVSSLKDLEDFLSIGRENLLSTFTPKARSRTTSALLSSVASA